MKNILRPLTPSIFGWITSFARAYLPRRLQRTPPRHPQYAIRLLPHRPRRPMARHLLHRLIWSRTRHQQGTGVWTRVPPRICLAPMPPTDAWILITHGTRTAQIFPGNMTSGIRVILHPSDGAHSWTLAARLMTIPTMGHVTPGTTRRVRIREGTPLMSPHIPIGPRMWMSDMAWMMKPIFHKGDRLFPPAIGIGANLLTSLGIALSMPRLSLVGNITGTSGGTIPPLPGSFPVVVIRMRAGRYLYTAMILFSSTDGLWMHEKIAAHNSVVRRWIESWRKVSWSSPNWTLWRYLQWWTFMTSSTRLLPCSSSH